MLKNIQQTSVSKRVTYFGTKLTVPRHTKFLAAHRKGYIHAFASRPKYDDDDPHWWDGNRICIVAVCDIDCADVKNSLVEVG